MAASCEIRVLGTFSLSVDGEEVSVDSWRSRRAADVVKLLAIEPEHRLHRERVMEALWPELSADAAAANLRKAIHYARRAVGSEDVVQVSDRVLGLWPSATLSIDLDRFHLEAADALASGDLDASERASALYSGELLPADRYEEWTEEARTRARSQYLALLKAAGRWGRVLELEPTDEVAHRAMMQKHLDAGDRREAIRQFESLRDQLREHVGVGPDAETVALYERVLAVEGHEPTSPAERAAALVANGLVAWGRRDLAEAERLAKEARSLSLDAEIGHELGEASTLLALVAYARGTWHSLFREEFRDAVVRGAQLEQAVYDAHLCFQEFYLYGPEGHEGADALANELLDIARSARSNAGQALATLLQGEFALLSGDAERASDSLRDAVRWSEASGSTSALSIALERLAEAEVVRGNSDRARELLERAWPVARASSIPSHLIVRLYGVQVMAAGSVVDTLTAVRDAERWLTDAARVCDPCSMTLRIEAARAYVRAGDLTRAHRHLSEAERITGLWQGGPGPWTAAIWEVRGEIRRAEGQSARAKALFLEAAGRYAELHRPVDESRCLAASAAF